MAQLRWKHLYAVPVADLGAVAASGGQSASFIKYSFRRESHTN